MYQMMNFKHFVLKWMCGISRERIEVECEKNVLRSKQPSKFVGFMLLIVYQIFFPEIYALTTVPQDPVWHQKERFEHTIQTIAAVFHVQNIKLKQKKAYSFYAALLSWFGKVATTINVDGKIRSWVMRKRS